MDFKDFKLLTVGKMESMSIDEIDVRRRLLAALQHSLYDEEEFLLSLRAKKEMAAHGLVKGRNKT